MPSQQVVTQLEGEDGLPPVQDQPEMLAEQSELHLSRFDMSPSSQNSVPITFESPHIDQQVEAEVELPPEQVHPATGPEHNELHLSVFKVSPSSHVSSGEITQLSPQRVLQVEIDPIAPVQLQPSSGPEQSNLHFLLSSIGIPSSQFSVVSQIPSQHIPVQIDGLLLSPPVQDHPNTFPEHKELHLSVFD